MLGNAGDRRCRPGWNRNLSGDRSHSHRSSIYLISEHLKESLLFVYVISNELLGEGLCGRNGVDCLNFARNEDDLVQVGWSWGRLCGPNGVYHILATNSDASRIDEKIEFLVTKKGNPVEPLNIGSSTSGPDRTWWQAHGRESHAATTRTFNRPLDIPIGGIVRDEIVLEG